MIEDNSFEKKFTPIIVENTLSFPEKGDIIKDGENNLVVCAVEKLDGKDYVLLCEEKSMQVALYDVIKTQKGFSYNLIQDDILFGKIILNICKNDRTEGEK